MHARVKVKKVRVSAALLQIPEDQLAFINDANDAGVVLFSLGTHVNEMEVTRAEMLARSLAKLPQRVVWHFPGDTSKLPLGNNTKVVQWMPMQKIMAHPNVKAVLCHGGSGMLHEAIWFGLPVVGIPLFGDQFDNIGRAMCKGIAVSLDLFDMTEESLHHAVNRVIDDPSFRRKVAKLSGILHDEPLIPTDKAAHWISHVTRFGGGHLQPRGARLGFVERNLLDVGVVLAAAGCFALWLGAWICRKSGSMAVCFCSKLFKRLKSWERV
ncbi:UDP-glucuronosyltransferase 2B31-like [Acanthaster planci]|uniref:UDP-glucuronosyltransferase 2B31-like n=1 Tax=Acanthaster planci TaxID=133434 RepID=A0A8B7XY93_ACAPL|nr:UDP-glucuronosyltransferase 2B31-like [Acanthaster planci]